MDRRVLVEALLSVQHNVWMGGWSPDHAQFGLLTPGCKQGLNPIAFACSESRYSARGSSASDHDVHVPYCPGRTGGTDHGAIHSRCTSRNIVDSARLFTAASGAIDPEQSEFLTMMVEIKSTADGRDPSAVASTLPPRDADTNRVASALDEADAAGALRRDLLG